MLGALLCINYAFAGDVNQTGTVKQFIQLRQDAPSLLNGSRLKELVFPQYALSNSFQNSMYQQVHAALADTSALDTWLSSDKKHSGKKVQLGMSGVPVLDQGVHGSCVTFAVTAALDAAMKKGDYISQLCLLQLGNHIEQEQGGLSGWNGLWNRVALDRIKKYGVITLKDQKKHGCAGVKQYPRYWFASDAAMQPESYLERSEKINGEQVTWKNLRDRQPKNQPSKMSTALKAALNDGNRVTFSVLLPRVDLGNAGATAWHHYFKDTWVLTQEIEDALGYSTEFPAHAIIITGYDDSAVAMDSHGRRHRGLFTVRNSWGPYVADWGDFYMSYDYFDSLVLEAHEIQAL